MNILVTGAAGFIGSHTCQKLAQAGHTVVGVDSFDEYLYPQEFKRETAAELHTKIPGFRLFETNICNRTGIEDIFKQHSFDVVCHLAALAGVRPSLQDPLRYIQTNVYGTGALLEACKNSAIPRFVFASSSSVYGVKATKEDDPSAIAPFQESDPCLAPASPYAATKRSGELICSTFHDLYGIGITLLRYFTVYGPRQRPDMAIARFVNAIVRGTPISMYGAGTSRRDYTYIDDIVAGTVAACERIEPHTYNIYNLGGTATTSLTKLITLVEKTVEKSAVVEQKGAQPGDVPITFANIERAQKDLDYHPSVSLEEGLSRYWTWVQQQQTLPA